MTTRFALLSLIIAASPVAAQQQPQQPPQQERWILGAHAGGSSATADFSSSTNWQTGWSAGANATYLFAAKLGVRADANFAQNDLSGGSGIPGEARFDKLALMGDVVYQTPKPMKSLAPYALAGIGAVRVADKGSDSSFTNFGGNLGLGVGYKLGRWGLRAEGRDLIYKFDHFGYDKTQNDLLWQGGVTIGL
ncbi:MAG TPA: outer membrane beta-barrel protein [Gemmatimonadales bacterium]|nr:outer membrane beta-barrel protein [Gemmatimonadales bacterium]